MEKPSRPIQISVEKIMPREVRQTLVGIKEKYARILRDGDLKDHRSRVTAMIGLRTNATLDDLKHLFFQQGPQWHVPEAQRDKVIQAVENALETLRESIVTQLEKGVTIDRLVVTGKRRWKTPLEPPPRGKATHRRSGGIRSRE